MVSSSSNFIKFFDGQTADGDSSIFKYFGRTQKVDLYVSGDLGGGTLKVQAKPILQRNQSITNNHDFVDLTGADAITAIGISAITLDSFYEIKVNLSGSSSANVTVGIFHQ